jgi:transcriptional repressor NF-X1
MPTCKSLCLKQLDDCSHACSSPCHHRSCPPCRVKLARPCRCGATTRNVECHGGQGGTRTEILCDRPCPALRNCGKHQCNRICCPLASFVGNKGKGKKKAEEDTLDEHGWHICDIVCGKPLSCGNHTCEESDHRGPCPPCLRSSFEEVRFPSCSPPDRSVDYDLQRFCHCSQTVLEPPIPCGTKIFCSYPCGRPSPPCGHTKHPHLCHEDPQPCPLCSFLTSKRCACGKKMVDNVTCSREKVFCGLPCGKWVFPFLTHWCHPLRHF